MGKIILTPLTERFINQKYLSWVNDPEVTEFLEIGSATYELEDLFSYINESKNSGRLNFAIIAADINLHIGNASIHSIDRANKKFEIGWIIGDKKYWGGHSASMTIFYLHKIGFTELGLEFCDGFVYEKHIKARMTNKFVGYSEIEKYLTFSKKLNMEVHLIKLAISKHDWLVRAKELEKLYPQFYRLS
jgi:RimJ/RimL family protein N-acetyltransferase